VLPYAGCKVARVRLSPKVREAPRRRPDQWLDEGFGLGFGLARFGLGQGFGAPHMQLANLTARC
jgi:hypothetical protein